MKVYKYFAVIQILWLFSCDEQVMNIPPEGNGVAPNPVSSPIVENLPGGAKITYELPDDRDLLYVKAEYFTSSGEKVVEKASKYTNTLTIHGFGDTLRHEVALYAVDENENSSTATVVQVTPLKPPVMEVFESLNIYADFGGVTVTFENETNADLAISVATIDGNGGYVDGETQYTSLKSGTFTARGYNAELQKFAVFIRDRWSNYSDTLISELTPYYEIQLDKSQFSDPRFPGDADLRGRPASNMWNDIFAGSDYVQTGTVATGEPMHLSIDLGVTAQLSRLNLKTCKDTRSYFADATLRRYEIWGSNNPNPDGSFDGWIKLVDHESLKPSGLPKGTLSDDDIAMGENGDDVTFPLDVPPVRYIRIRCLENWLSSNNTHILIGELTFWGSPVQY